MKYGAANDAGTDLTLLTSSAVATLIVRNHGDGTVAIEGENDSNGRGVSGRSESGTGVMGQSGAGGAGVTGSGGAWGVLGASQNGTGVQAESASGIALRVHGTAVFTRSGLATVPAGDISVRVSGVALSSSSLILATLQKKDGHAHVRAAVPDVAAHSFTIYLTRPPTIDLPVGWFVVN
jgi:hypothetical protein